MRQNDITYRISCGRAASSGHRLKPDIILNALRMIEEGKTVRHVIENGGISKASIEKYLRLKRSIGIEGIKNTFALYKREGFIDSLRDLEIFNKKRIPDIYLKNSFDNRLQLLAGLIDTDYYLAGGAYEFTLCNEAWLDDIKSLVDSLGFMSIKKNVTKICFNAVNGPKEVSAWKLRVSGGPKLMENSCQIGSKSYFFKNTKI